MSTRQTIFSFVAIFALTGSSFGIPIKAPDTSTIFRLTVDDTSSGNNEVVWFSFSSTTPGNYAVVIEAELGTPVFEYYGNSWFSSIQKTPVTTYSTVIGIATWKIWVYPFTVTSPLPQTYYMSVRGGAPGGTNNDFKLYVCPANKIQVTSENQSAVLADTTLYIPTKRRLALPQITLPMNFRFDHWSIVSGSGTINDSLNPTGTWVSSSDLHVVRHLNEWKLPVLSTGKYSMSIASDGITGYPADGIYFRFEAPEPGYYGYKSGRSVNLKETSGDTCPANNLFNREMIMENQHEVFKDSITDRYSVLLIDDRGSLSDSASFIFEIEKAPLLLTVDSTPFAMVFVSPPNFRFVPGWKKYIGAVVDQNYNLDSIRVIQGTATIVSNLMISLQTNATVKAYVSEKPVFTLNHQWQVRDFIKDKWSDNIVAFSFKPESADTFTVSAFLNDTAASWSFCPVGSKSISYGSPTISGKGMLSYTFYGKPDSTYQFKMICYYLTGCKQLAAIAYRKGPSLPDKPVLCNSNTAISGLSLERRAPSKIVRYSNRRLFIENSAFEQVALFRLDGTIINVSHYPVGKGILIEIPVSVSPGIYCLLITRNKKSLLSKFLLQ